MSCVMHVFNAFGDFGEWNEMEEDNLSSKRHAIHNCY